MQKYEDMHMHVLLLASQKGTSSSQFVTVIHYSTSDLGRDTPTPQTASDPTTSIDSGTEAELPSTSRSRSMVSSVCTLFSLGLLFIGLLVIKRRLKAST